MARLIYMTIASLDGYVADEDGKYDWARPDDEVFGFVNDFERPIGTYLYGRRLYEEMTGWETLSQAGQPPLALDFAQIWRAADKVVFSRSLEAVSTPRTRIERDFDPRAVRQLKASAGRDVTVGGPAWRPRRSRPAWSTSATCSSPRRGGRRQEVPPQRGAPAARTARGAAVRQRCGVPALRHRTVTRGPEHGPEGA